MLKQITDAIDAEIATRKNDQFGIRFSLDLFNVLVRAKKIKMTTFGVLGTTFLPAELPAYNGKYYASIDVDMEGLEFEVGVPK